MKNGFVFPGWVYRQSLGTIGSDQYPWCFPQGGQKQIKPFLIEAPPQEQSDAGSSCHACLRCMGSLQHAGGLGEGS